VRYIAKVTTETDGQIYNDKDCAVHRVAW